MYVNYYFAISLTACLPPLLPRKSFLGFCREGGYTPPGSSPRTPMGWGWAIPCPLWCVVGVFVPTILIIGTEYRFYMVMRWGWGFGVWGWVCRLPPYILPYLYINLPNIYNNSPMNISAVGGVNM